MTSPRILSGLSGARPTTTCLWQEADDAQEDAVRQSAKLTMRRDARRTENRVLALHVDQLAYQDYRLDMADLVTRVEACLTSNKTSADCVRGSHGPMGTWSFSCLALISKTTTATINAQNNNFRYLSCVPRTTTTLSPRPCFVGERMSGFRIASRPPFVPSDFSHQCSSADGRPACNSWYMVCTM